jgi:predicted nucleotidyltransferase component of viral defense system
MLTTAQLRQAAARSGARDIGVIEIDVMLTHLLQLFQERGLTEHLAFKGGTFLRKMVFGPRGRLSTDLDFTCRTTISHDDLIIHGGTSACRLYQFFEFTSFSIRTSRERSATSFFSSLFSRSSAFNWCSWFGSRPPYLLFQR